MKVYTFEEIWSAKEPKTPKPNVVLDNVVNNESDSEVAVCGMCGGSGYDPNGLYDMCVYCDANTKQTD